MAITDFFNNLLPTDPDKRDAVLRGLMTTGLSMMKYGGQSYDRPVSSGAIIGQAGLEGLNAYDQSLNQAKQSKFNDLLYNVRNMDYQNALDTSERTKQLLASDAALKPKLLEMVNRQIPAETSEAYKKRVGIEPEFNIEQFSPEEQANLDRNLPMQKTSLAERNPQILRDINRMGIDKDVKLGDLTPKPNLFAAKEGETIFNTDTMTPVWSSPKSGTEKEMFKAPLPTTDKGWTVSTNAKGINVARKQGTNNEMIEEPYNPDIHGEATFPGKSLDSSAIEFEAEKYLATGVLPATGMSGQGKLQIMNRAAQIARERGLTGKAAVIENAAFNASKLALNNDEKQYDLMHKAELQATKAADLLQQSSSNYQRTNVRFINSLEALARNAVTDPKLADLQMKLLAFSREYYKVVTNAYASVQELSVGAQAQADKLLSTSDSWESLNAKIQAAKQEMANTNRTFIQTITERKAMMNAGGKRPNETPAGSGARDLTPAVTYLKGASQTEVKQKIQALAAQGWTRTELLQIIKDSGLGK